MKILLIGGTGIISMAISRQLAIQGHELYLLNRGNRNHNLATANVHHLHGNIHDETEMVNLLEGLDFDVVADFIAFLPAHIERDYRLFSDITKQYIFISSATVYQKPPVSHIITEGTALGNPYWEYARNKIACENVLTELYRESGFPVTIVRPSHTYDERTIPLGVYGSQGTWQVAQRMLDGKPVIIHGDGSSLWTMTHNSDFAKGFIGLLGHQQALGEAFHITSDESLTWTQIYRSIADALDVPLKPIYISSHFLDANGPYDYEGGLIGDKANSVVFDNTKLKRIVPEFKATTRFHTGVKKTVDHILDHPELQVLDPEFDLWCDQIIAAYSDISIE